MTEDGTDDLRFPIGRFNKPEFISDQQIAAWISDLEALPQDLRRAVQPLSDEQLDTPYRHGGWTVRQVVHHLPDSHFNSFLRFKWTLTEDRPTIKDYREDRFANLADYRDTPVETSLDLLAALHTRWTTLLRSLDATQLERQFVHPESGATRLKVNIGIYAWHGRHHLAHIESLAKREG